MKKAFKQFSGSLKVLSLSTIFCLSANISFADTARDFTNRSNYMPGKKYRLFGTGRGDVTNLRGNVTRQGGMSYTVGNIQTDIATYGGKIEYNQEFHNHGWRVHSPFSSSASRSFDSKTGSPAAGGQTVTSFSVQGFEVHPADGYDGEQGGGYPTPTGARDEYTYIVSGTERTIRVVNQPDKPQPPQPEKPNQNNDKGDKPNDKTDNQERDREEKLAGLDDNSSNGEYDLSNLSNEDLAQWLAEQLREAELNTQPLDLKNAELWACLDCPSPIASAEVALAERNLEALATLVEIGAVSSGVYLAAQNGDWGKATSLHNGSSAAGGAMPPDDENKKNNKNTTSDTANQMNGKSFSEAEKIADRELLSRGWQKSPLKNGDGVRYFDGKGNSVQINKGYANSNNIHGGPYVKYTHGSQVIRIPLKGNPIGN